MTQLADVLRAVTEGYESAETISAVVGLSRQRVSAYLSLLREDGVIRVKPGAPRSRSNGRPFNLYEPVPKDPQ